MLFLVAALHPPGAQATNRVASVVAYGRSLTMTPAITRIPGVSDESMRFATYDGTNTFPLHTRNGQPFTYNGEVRLRTNAVYETDYLLLIDGFAHEYGTLTFNLPTADSDTNGVPDFLQSDRAVNAALTGSGIIHAKDGFTPGVNTNTITISDGLFSRGENEMKGDFSFSMSTSGRAAITTQGKWVLWQISGSAYYERETRNKLSLGLMLTNGNGASVSYTGSTT